MGNLNKVLLLGRLSRDVESRAFANGGKVANFGFVVNNAKKNSQTGQWEDEPVWLEVKAFDYDKGGKNATLAENHLAKGNQCLIEGHLTLEQWTDRDGNKRQMLKIIADKIQLVERRKGDEDQQRPSQQRPKPNPQGYVDGEIDPNDTLDTDEIPF